MITVIFGVNEMNLQLAGKTIAEIRKAVAPLLGLTGEEKVLLNSERLEAMTEIEDGDVVEFVKETGEKGSR
jgi:hypothetical protein